MRALFDVQNQHLAQARQAGVDDLEQVRGWRDRVLGAMVVTFFVMAMLLAVLVRSAVTRPLAALAAACRRITEGNFGRTIIPRGPKDIRAIATDVEDMRQRIVDELDAAQVGPRDAGRAGRSNCGGPTPNSSSSPTSRRTTCRSRCARSPSFCQLLEKRYGDQLDERGIEYIGFAVDGAKRMQVLINDLLTFSRVGRLNATNTEVDLDAALDAALGNLATAIEESGAEIVRPAQPLPHVDGDPTLLAMLWQNLIGNAVKFRRDGVAPRIVIECEAGTGEHAETWLFSVSDNGIGIAQGVRRQGLRHLPAAARPRRVRRNGHRPGAVQEDRRAPRRHHLDRHGLHERHPVLLHPACHAHHRTKRDPPYPNWKEQHD